MSEQKNRKALADAADAWNAGQGDRYLALYDPAITHHGLGPQPLDEQGNRNFYQALWDAFPGARLTIDDVVAEGEKLAARFHIDGEHKGEFMGVPPTGRSIVLQGHTTMVLRDGRVTERWTTGDLMGLLVQLGALPAPGS